MITKESKIELWRQDEVLRGLEATLANKQSGIRVVSFDFFDTLVCRLCAEPSDLFIEVGRRLAKQGLLISPLSPAEFRGVRIAADEQARAKAIRAGRSPEVTLTEIYAELTHVVSDTAAAGQLEFEMERLFCYLNPAMASLVKHVRSLGYRTAIVSDTYFTRAQLFQLLKDSSLSPDLFNDFFISSERGKAKWNAHLYHDLCRQLDVHPSEVLHIGDNEKADITVPRGFGVHAVHYPKLTLASEALFDSERALRGTNIHTAGALHSLRVLVARRAESQEDQFRDGAFTFGPALSRFADWAVQQFAKAGVRKVLALMREGEVLGELLQNAAKSAGIPLEVVPCYASRLATGRAAMQEVTPQNAATLLDGCGGLTAQAIMEILGLGEEAAKGFSADQARKVLNTPQSIAKFLVLLFNQPTARAKIEARRKESFELAFDYLTELTAGETCIGIMDLGWSASIQRHIARILRQGGRTIRTTGCYLACTRRAGRVTLEGDAAHAYMDEDWDRSPILLELAVSACIGSTNSYARNAAGKVVPILGGTEFAPEEREARARLRQGILAFQSMWLSLCESKGRANFSLEMLADIDRQSASILYRLLDYPTKAEAVRLGLLRHDENYSGSNGSAPLCDTQSATLLRQTGIINLYRMKQHWPQGVVAQHFPRLISAMRDGWSRPFTLGRLGATDAMTPAESTVTDEELGSLGGLLSGFKPEQIILCGPLTPAIKELFRFLWQRNGAPQGQAQPRLIIVGKAEADPWLAEFKNDVSFIADDPSAYSTVLLIREQLTLSSKAMLVLADETKPSIARPLLNGLAPFLGSEGIVLAACGRYDRNVVEEEAPLARPVKDWWTSIGKEIGYSTWTPPGGAEEHLSNWLVLHRAPQDIFWNRQWMFFPGDMAPKLESAAA